MMRKIEAMTNRAVFEVPGILEQIFHQLRSSLQPSHKTYELAGANIYRHAAPAAAMGTEINPIDAG
jgi:hypothetical protein